MLKLSISRMQPEHSGRWSANQESPCFSCGECQYSVFTTPSEALAREEYKKCGRNYLLRYERQPDGMHTSWWDDDLNYWRE